MFSLTKFISRPHFLLVLASVVVTALFHNACGQKSKIAVTLKSGAGCQKGLESFQKNLHPLLRDHCVKCHDSGSVGPPHSVADPAESYQRILAYQNFADIPASLFVQKGGNMHCLHDYHFDCNMDKERLLPAVTAWWQEGEKTCKPVGKYLTASLELPSTLPPRGAGFSRLRIGLDSLGDEFAGSIFEIEAQHFAEMTSAHPGAYLFRRPRIAAAGAMGIHALSIQMVLNGLGQPEATAFSSVDMFAEKADFDPAADIWPTPVLSTKGLVVIQSKPVGDNISIAFGDLQLKNSTAICRKLEQFKADVLPTMEARGCFSCHGGGSDHQTGDSPLAKARFSMALDEQTLCNHMLSYAVSGDPMESPLIEISVKGALSHPMVFLSPGEAIPAWPNWIEAERAR